jgi:esterase/lipase
MIESSWEFVENIITNNSKYKNISIFLIGLSLGGSIVLDMIINNPNKLEIKGYIAVSPIISFLNYPNFLPETTKLQLSKLADEILNKMDEIKENLFLIGGEKDDISDISLINELHLKNKSLFKALKIYKDGTHYLNNDSCAIDLDIDILEWIFDILNE